MRRAYLVYNPSAGRFPPRKKAEGAGRVLEAAGWEVFIKESEGGEHLVRLARQAAEEGMDAFFVAGGDGSIGKAVDGLVGTETALGVLPSGTANVWAQEMGLRGLTWTNWRALETSAKRQAQAPARAVDLGVCNGSHFLMWAGVGLDALVVGQVETRYRWEKHFATLRFGASTLRNAVTWKGMDLQIEADGQRLSGHYVLAVVSNIRRYAGGISKISPQARLDDGIMDLWLFAGDSFSDSLQHAWNLITNRHGRSNTAQRVPFQRLILESDSPLHVQLDGDLIEESSRVEIEVLHEALRVLAPGGGGRGKQGNR